MGERPYGELVDSLRTGIIVWRLAEAVDPTSLVLVYANPAASRLSGVNLEGQTGRRIGELFPRARDRKSVV